MTQRPAARRCTLTSGRSDPPPRQQASVTHPGSVCLSVCRSVRQPVGLSVCLSVRVSVFTATAAGAAPRPGGAWRVSGTGARPPALSLSLSPPGRRRHLGPVPSAGGRDWDARPENERKKGKIGTAGELPAQAWRRGLRELGCGVGRVKKGALRAF